MSGTTIGGKRASITNIKRYGKDFYRRIGAKGGRNGNTGGFASDKIGEDGMTGRERAIVAGRKGGLVSRRGPAKDEIDKAEEILEKESGRNK